MNTIWPLAASPYVVSCSGVTVAPGATLQIEPGVIVKFDVASTICYSSLLVDGNLIAEGTDSQKIVFTSILDDTAGGDSNGDGSASTPSTGAWGGIQFRPGATGSVSNAVLRYGGNGNSYSATIRIATGNSSPTVSGNSITESNIGVDIYGADTTPTVSGNLFSGNYSSPVRISYLAAPVVTGNSFEQFSTGVFVDGAREATISGNTFNLGMNAVPISIDPNFGGVIAENTLAGTGIKAVQIRPGSVSGSVTWGQLNIPYFIRCAPVQTWTVPAGQSLTIPPGVIVKFDVASTICYSSLLVDGNLIAEGTDSQKIVFTSILDDTAGGDTNGDGSASTPSTGAWGGIQFRPGATGSVSNAVLRYGGNGNSYSATIRIATGNSSPTVSGNSITESSIGIDIYGADTTPTVSGNLFSGNYSSPVRISYLAAPVVTGNSFEQFSTGVFVDGAREARISGNTFNLGMNAVPISIDPSFGGVIADNTVTGTGIKAVQVRTGTVSINTTWSQVDMPYHIACGPGGAVDVSAGAVLTIQPGVILKFQSGSAYCFAALRVYGGLVINGAAAWKAVFTSILDDAAGGDTNGDDTASAPSSGAWGGIIFAYGATGSIRNAAIRYGGHSSATLSMLNISTGNSSPSVTDSSITDGLYGIQIAGSSANANPMISGNTFTSLYTAIAVSGAAPTITNNTLSGYGIGISVTGGGTPHINFNNIAGNSGYGVFNVDCSDNVECTTTPNVDATNNYWGAPNGPSRDSDRLGAGYGDKVSWHVNFEPYGHTEVGPPPSITSIVPVSGEQGQTISNFTINGSEFQSGAALSFSPGGIIVDSIAVTATQIVANLTVAPDAPVGARDVVVTNPDSQQAVLAGSFIVTIAVPTTGRITVTTNRSNATFTIEGPVNYSGTGTSYTQDNAPVGTYKITYGSIPGYDSPPTEIETLAAGAAIEFSGTYQLIPAPVITKGLGSKDPGTVLLSVVEPISSGNGNFYHQHIDFAIPGRGIPVVFQRTYNTLDNYAGPLGANWTHSYNIILFESANGDVAIKWGDGHGENFMLSGSVYLPQPGVFSTLEKNADGTFFLTEKSQRKYAFLSNGKLASIQDRNGNTILLTYDAGGDLAQIADTVGRTLTFSYDDSGRIIQVVDPADRTIRFEYSPEDDLITAVDAAGGVTQYSYDANHRVTSIIQPNGQPLLQNVYDAAGRVISQTNGRGFTTTLSYDTPTPGETQITDARGSETVHVYDGSLRIIGVINALSGTVSYTYDANNNRTSMTNQNGKTTAYAYDARGNIMGITDPLGNMVGFSYDARNNLLSVTNAKGRMTSYEYDANGNLVKITDALGNVTQFACDSSGQVVSKTDARGNIATYGYDTLGNLTRIKDALGNVTALAYETIGRLISITDPNGHTATAAYDRLSRLITITDPLGNITRFDYDPAGNLLKITDANGNATRYAYDTANNLTTVSDALGNVTAYAYDQNNNRSRFTNAKGNVTSYAYDALNRLIGITDPLSSSTLYDYDAVGNVIAILDANSRTNRFGYDDLNRLMSINYADGKSVAYFYDENGNRTAMTDTGGTTTYAYDVLDRLFSVRHPGGKVVTYAYDAVGNRKSLAYPDGKLISYSYDQSNRLSQVTDWLGRPTVYSYDAASNLAGFTYPNGASSAFTYDAANRLLRISNAYRGSTKVPLNPVTSFTYVLDAVGNRLQVTDGSGKPTFYAYDALNQLKSVTRDAKVTTFTYDSVGNRINLAGPGNSVNYSYDAANHLLSAGGFSLAYDRNGNQIAKTTGKKTTAFTYDAANRLASVSGPGINSRFAYDGDGNRISQSISTGIYWYVNDVATALPVVLQESGPDGNISYTYGLGQISTSGASFEYFNLFDGLGTVVGLTELDGNLKGRYGYDAWGQTDLTVRDPQVGTQNKYRFSGEALDPETGLYYLRARYYDPTLGRFVTRDPASGFSRFPSTLNRYTYALNNPILYVDPSGFTPVEVSGRVPELQQVALTSSAGPRFSKWLNDTMNAPAQWLGEKLSQFLPLDIWDYIEKLKIFAETEAMRAKFYAQMDIIVDDAAGLIDQGFSIDEALNIATRKVGTPVDVIETEKLKILFAGYPTLTSVAQIKAELKRPH